MLSLRQFTCIDSKLQIICKSPLTIRRTISLFRSNHLINEHDRWRLVNAKVHPVLEHEIILLIIVASEESLHFGVCHCNRILEYLALTNFRLNGCCD